MAKTRLSKRSDKFASRVRRDGSSLTAVELDLGDSEAVLREQTLASGSVPDVGADSSSPVEPVVAAPVKRGRGRPRKNPVVVSPEAKVVHVAEPSRQVDVVDERQRFVHIKRNR